MLKINFKNVCFHDDQNAPLDYVQIVLEIIHQFQETIEPTADHIDKVHLVANHIYISRKREIVLNYMNMVGSFETVASRVDELESICDTLDDMAQGFNI